MLKLLIAITLLFAAPALSFAKTPKCPKGDKSCAKRAGKKNKKSEQKSAKKNKKAEKKVAKKAPEKKKKKGADVSEPMPSRDSAAASPNSPSTNVDDIFPEPTPPSSDNGGSDDFVDEAAPSE